MLFLEVYVIDVIDIDGQQSIRNTKNNEERMLLMAKEQRKRFLRSRRPKTHIDRSDEQTKSDDWWQLASPR